MNNTIRLRDIAQSTAERLLWGEIDLTEAVNLIETAHETERAYLALAFASFLPDSAELALREELIARLKRREWRSEPQNRN